MAIVPDPVKHVTRRLMRSPLFTAITLITLAVGIGASTAIFSVLSGVLLKPLPFPESDRLVAIWQTAPGLSIKELNAAPATYFTYREEGKAFQDSAIWHNDSVSVTGLAQPEQVDALDVTDGLFPILGVQMARGRSFSRQDDTFGSPHTVILSYGYWQRKFGGDPNAIGKTIKVDGDVSEIIGILPQNFHFMNSHPALVLPLQLNRGKVFVGNFSYQAVARLKPGITLAQANADVARMIPMLMQKFPPAPGMSNKMLEDAKLGPNVRPLKNDVVGDVGNVLWVLMGTVGIVLLIACANVTNLLLVRAEGRQQELSIRAALGAGTKRIAGELLLESVLLGILGGALGVGLAYGALQLIVAMGPTELPRLDEISIDWPVLLFTTAVSLVAGLLFGLIPVFKYAVPGLGNALRQGGRNTSDSRERHRARNLLVVVQVGLALVLLICSGLMIRTLGALKDVQPGFSNPADVLTLRVSIPETLAPKPEQTIRMDEEMLRKISAIPGVTSAGLVNSVTMDGYNDNDPVFAEGRTYSEGQIPTMRRFKFVGPDSFKTVGNPLLIGRDMTWTDIYELRPVVLVSESLARDFWKDPASAIGKQVRENPKAPWREVIGVVGNERDDGVDHPASAVVYFPLMVKDFWGSPVSVQRNLAFVIRSNRAQSSALLSQVRDAVWSVNREIPIAAVRTLKEVYDKSMARTKFTLVMLSIAAAMALLLGVVGIYGVISYSVSRRTREVGIRIAIGAQHGMIKQMFVREGLMLTAVGLGCGMAAAFALTRLMSTLLFGVSPLDPVTYAAAATALLTAALLASYLPARRAVAVEPAIALLAE